MAVTLEAALAGSQVHDQPETVIKSCLKIQQQQQQQLQHTHTHKGLGL